MKEHQTKQPQTKMNTNWFSRLAAIGLLTAAGSLAFAATPADKKKAVKEGTVTTKAAAENSEAGRHFSKAEQYQQQAYSYQQEIKQVWKDYAVESKKIAVLPKAAVENPYLRKLRLQTEERVKGLEAKVQESTVMANYHWARAREAQEAQLSSKLTQ